ncbi:MAG TPA: hypothetical protein VEG26_03035 [Steroidobacteraceae bacterium]|nr:hypothetical protein [Steroidobacteraceae bacterium]
MIPLSRTAGRILRWIGLVAGSLALIALALCTLAFAINWRDEPLTPQARALRAPPPNPLKPEDNIYIAMAGFTAPAGASVIAAGQDRIGHYNERLDAVLHDPSAPALDSLTLRIPGTLEFRGQAEFVRPLSGSLWDEAPSHREQIEALTAANSELYQRYLALQRLPGYYETARPSYLAPAIFVPTEVRYLFLEDTVLRLRGAKAHEQRAALVELLADVALWQRVLIGQGLLISKMLALAYLQSDCLVLADMIADPHAAVPEGPGDADDVAPLFALEDFSLGGAFAAEFRVQASLLEQTQYLYTIGWSPQPADDAAPRRWTDRLGSLISAHFFKLNATVNLFAQQAERLTALRPGPGVAAADKKLADSSLAAWSLVGAYNPIGKLLAGIAAPAGVTYPLRAWDAAALQRLVRAGYEIRRQRIAPADVPAFLARHPEWSTHPGDGRPFVWQPGTAEIRVQTIGEQPEGRRFSIHVWRSPGAGEAPG